jgi:hypothetical protein
METLTFMVFAIFLSFTLTPLLRWTNVLLVRYIQTTVTPKKLFAIFGTKACLLSMVKDPFLHCLQIWYFLVCIVFTCDLKSCVALCIQSLF